MNIFWDGLSNAALKL